MPTSQFYQTKKEILDWLILMEVDNAVVADDLSVTVYGDVSIVKKKVEFLPVQFSVIHGSFNCNSNHLQDLRGAPDVVEGTFYCTGNHLVTIKGGPSKVGGQFICTSNRLCSLEGAPREVGKGFMCFGNEITSLYGAPEKIGGEFVSNGMGHDELHAEIKKLFLAGKSFSASNLTAICQEVQAEIRADEMRAVVAGTAETAAVKKRRRPGANG